MNNAQRQILSDRINEVSKSIDREAEIISNLESRLEKHKILLDYLNDEFLELSEDVDW